MLSSSSKHRLYGALLVAVLAAGCATTPGASDLVNAEELLDILEPHALEVDPIGSYGRPISATGPESQEWFNQGLRYYYGFNHDQAAACFARAAQASPQSPMAWWGIAQSFGIDVNNPVVTPEEAAWASIAIAKASELSDTAPPVEQALIAATAKRALATLPEDRSGIDLEYSDALRAAHAAHPADSDLAVLYAESMMLCQPWAYWTPEGEPLDQALETVEVLESAMEMDPNNPGANHLYIHIMEASREPGRAEAAADRLATQMPGSGHLVHMPSHIYVLVGRYDDAVRANQRASELDQAYFNAYENPTFYRIYYIHNLQFVAYAAMLEGRLELALQYADEMEARMPVQEHMAMAFVLDGLFAMKAHVLVRFGRWEEILDLPEHDDFRLASRAMRRYARTVALANLGRTEEARAELTHLDEAAAQVPEEWMISFNPAGVVLDLARGVAEAEILWREGRPNEALELLAECADTERNLIYTEPPAWPIPVRHAIGAIQVATGDSKGAIETYQQDLKRLPNNAWSLLGLQQAFDLAGYEGRSEALAGSVEAAWARADEVAPASCYCGVALEGAE